MAISRKITPTKSGASDQNVGEKEKKPVSSGLVPHITEKATF